MGKPRKSVQPQQVQEMALVELDPAPYNPRKISDAALEGLTESLKRFGLVEPIVWNKRTGHVVGGHQRLKALQRIGETHSYVVVVDLPETEERALNLTLNNPHVQGEFTGDLANVLAEIEQDLMSDLRLDVLVGDEDDTTVDEIKELKEWDASELVMMSVFEFRGPIELQAKVREVLHREFPGAEFEEGVVYG